ncbi:MAG TPA: hypothetical protein VIS10_18825 [Anaerolineales bacterium]
MTFKQKTTQEKQTPFDISACMAMMEKMMGEHMAGCDCAEMMSQITGQAEVPDEWLKVMSQMMELHCQPLEGADKRAQVL